MSRAHRLLGLLQELRARRRPVTAEALAAALGVSVRTLYRDINVLRAQGARIEGEAGFGYVLRPGFLLPPLMFTADEIEVLLLGASWAARRQDLAMEACARSALAKIAAVLPPEMAQGLDTAGLVVAATGETRAIAADPALIRKALRAERKLAIAYADGSCAVSERIIWPVALGVFDATQLLAAWCELRGDFRHFRLDRITRVQMLEARLPRRRAALHTQWRERERGCMPPGITEQDVGSGLRSHASP
jgi:predicted DNA-binding transcriptional regulator YafY